MDVYFNINFWGKPKGKPGVPEKVERIFEIAKATCYIPCIYTFNEGIAIDFFTLAETETAHEFFETATAASEGAAPWILRKLQSDNPLQDFSIANVFVNDIALQRISSCGTTLLPWSANDLYRSAVTAYPFLNEKCFHWQRIFARSKNMPTAIHRIALHCAPTAQYYPIVAPFTLDTAASQDVCVTFMHPLCKTQHTLYGIQADAIEIPGSAVTKAKQGIVFVYEIAPPLPKGHDLQLYEMVARDASDSIGMIGVTAGENLEATHGGKIDFRISDFCDEPRKIQNWMLEGIEVPEFAQERIEFAL